MWEITVPDYSLIKMISLIHIMHLIWVGLWCLMPPFNNISVISWWSVLLVEETGVRRENHQPVASHWQTLSHNVVLNGSRHERDSKIWEITVPDYFLIKIIFLIHIMHSIWEITVPDYFLIKIIFPIHKNVFDMGDNCSWLFLYENYLPCT